jgi:hypothetical protein
LKSELKLTFFISIGIWFLWAEPGGLNMDKGKIEKESKATIKIQSG